ncbi:outer membrane protein [Spongiibacter sp. IMCC21906]|jgi:cobalt-zinc-cadmium efflux system outer membrane protein|uniref:TolC family protein n=1 Tax=Spongiibacter sp. IMCC21906 TaxID=1620392 RepID=UPI00062DE26E|nr:TolC family protein [Spongiibacter sp. IMCC21906]AKH68780.1 outer membrane protein [Spongiibacter sp. IMCC21906]
MHNVSSSTPLKIPIYGRFFVAVCAPLLMYLVLSQGVHAAEPDLTLGAAIQRSFASHPDLQAFAYRRDIAQGNLRQSGVGTPPSLDMQVEDGFGSGDYADTQNLQSTLAIISWVVEGDLLDTRQQSARQRLSLLDDDYRIKRLDVAAETGRRFMTLLGLQRKRELAAQVLEMAEDTASELGQRQRAGKTSAVDTLRAQAARARAELALEDYDHEIRSQGRKLAALWNERQFAESVSGDLSTTQPTLDFNALRAALASNPAVARLLTQERMTQSEIALAKAEAKSRWRFSAGVRRYEASDDVGLVAGVSIPLGGERRARGQIEALKAEAALHAVNADNLRLELETRLFVLAQEYNHALHVAEALRDDIIPTLKQALVESRQSYLRGRHSYQEWAAVRNEWLSAKEDLLDSQLSAHLTYLEIERLTGLPTQLMKEVNP